MPLSHRSPKLCPWTEWKILNGSGSSSSSRSPEFSNPPEARKHDFPLHFMVCWIFCFSYYIAGIMFMALEYSCGFPNASDLIWHLPHAQKFIASYTLSLWMLSLPQSCGGVLEMNNDPVELFLSWWEALPGASADSDGTRRQLLMGRRGQPRPSALAWAPNTHLRK